MKEIVQAKVKKKKEERGGGGVGWLGECMYNRSQAEE